MIVDCIKWAKRKKKKFHLLSSRVTSCLERNISSHFIYNLNNCFDFLCCRVTSVSPTWLKKLAAVYSMLGNSVIYRPKAACVLKREWGFFKALIYYWNDLISGKHWTFCSLFYLQIIVHLLLYHLLWMEEKCMQLRDRREEEKRLENEH